MKRARRVDSPKEDAGEAGLSPQVPSLPPEVWGQVLVQLPLRSEAPAWLQLMRTCRATWDLGLHLLRQVLQSDPQGVDLVSQFDVLGSVLWMTGSQFKFDFELLETVLSLLCNEQLMDEQACMQVFEFYPPSSRGFHGKYPTSHDTLGNVFYRKQGSRTLKPLLEHPRLKVARQGSDKRALEKALRYLRKKVAPKHKTRAVIYSGYLKTSMSPVAKRALCYTVRQPKLERAGPKDKLFDAVIDGKHLFSTIDQVGAGLKFYMCRGDVLPAEKLIAVRRWKRGGFGSRVSRERIQQIRKIERRRYTDPMELAKIQEQIDAGRWSIEISDSDDDAM